MFGSPDPARKSGFCPGPKMNRSEILSLSPCASERAGEAIEMTRAKRLIARAARFYMMEACRWRKWLTRNDVSVAFNAPEQSSVTSLVVVVDR